MYYKVGCWAANVMFITRPPTRENCDFLITDVATVQQIDVVIVSQKPILILLIGLVRLLNSSVDEVHGLVGGWGGGSGCGSTWVLRVSDAWFGPC